MAKSPFPWFGGKALLVNKLLKLIPPHTHYIEVFGGGASLLLAKRPCSVEFYNDIDKGLVNFFRVIRDEDKYKRFIWIANNIPYSREEYYEFLKTIDDESDSVVKAAKWYYIARSSFGGKFGQSWGYALERSNALTYHNSLNNVLPKVHDRFKNVYIENRDWRFILNNYGNKNFFMYLDPPYVPSTRHGGVYEYELTSEDHRELIDIIIDSKAMIMLSGYRNAIYNKLNINGWDVTEFNVVCNTVGKTKYSNIGGKGSLKKDFKRTEVVWRNPILIEAINNKGSLF